MLYKKKQKRERKTIGAFIYRLAELLTPKTTSSLRVKKKNRDEIRVLLLMNEHTSGWWPFFCFYTIYLKCESFQDPNTQVLLFEVIENDFVYK